MKYSRQEVIDKLLEGYKAYYNISLIEDDSPLVAVCEFYEHSQRYVMSRKAELWSANCEEFIYLFNVEHLTLEVFEKYRDWVKENGLAKANIGPGHMYTYLTPVFICDKCDKDVIKAVRRCRIYKSFHFSLHGWMDYHVAVLETDTDRITTNGSGKCVGKIMNKLLYKKKKGRSY